MNKGSKASNNDLILLKSKITGDNLKALLKKKGLSKWKTAKECRITYRTLLNWQKEITEPSDELALRVAEYLGLINLSDVKKHELKEGIQKLQDKLDRLS